MQLLYRNNFFSLKYVFDLEYKRKSFQKKKVFHERKRCEILRVFWLLCEVWSDETSKLLIINLVEFQAKYSSLIEIDMIKI